MLNIPVSLNKYIGRFQANLSPLSQKAASIIRWCLYLYIKYDGILIEERPWLNITKYRMGRKDFWENPVVSKGS